MPSITQLEYALALHEIKHFRKAAEFCHVSQPTLSQQIMLLEDHLGFIIFDRSKRPILTTEKGLELIKKTKIILNELKQIEEIKHLDELDLQGEFKLGVIPTIAPYLLPLFVESFSKKYPKIKLFINEYKTEDIIHLVKNDKLDAGILVSPLQEKDIIERHLFYERFFIYAHKKHPYLKKKTIKMNQLDQDDLWLLQEGHCFRNQVLNICQDQQQKTIINNVYFEGGNLETLINMINEGEKGHTFIPELLRLKMSKSQQEKFTKAFQSPSPTREISICYGRSFYKEKILDALEESILQAIPNQLQSLKKKSLSIIDIQ